MNLLLVALAVAVAILSVARTARLLVWDDYPPMQWTRDAWDRKVTNGWNKLAHCAFCLTPYLAVGMVLWLLGVQPWDNPGDRWSADWWWWVVNLTWGGSYLAAILVAYDQPDE